MVFASPKAFVMSTILVQCL